MYMTDYDGKVYLVVCIPQDHEAYVITVMPEPVCKRVYVYVHSW